MSQNLTYKHAQRYVKEKDRYVQEFIHNALNKLQSMFAYDGLPDSLPKEELERQLLMTGHTFVTEVNGNLYALAGAPGGEPDPYNRPTVYTVANAALKLSQNYIIDQDGVMITNDYMASGMLPIINRYAVLMCDTDISLNTVSVLSRITTFISANDDKSKASAELFMQKILNGDLSIIGGNALFGTDGGIQTHTAATGNSNILMNLVETLQYYKASFLNEIGLNANYNMKREYMNENETATNIDALLPLMDNMLDCRRAGMEKVNTMFGTSIKVDFDGVWKATHEQAERIIVESLTNYTKAIQEEATVADPTGGPDPIDDPPPSGPEGGDDGNRSEDAQNGNTGSSGTDSGNPSSDDGPDNESQPETDGEKESADTDGENGDADASGSADEDGEEPQTEASESESEGEKGNEATVDKESGGADEDLEEVEDEEEEDEEKKK